MCKVPFKSKQMTSLINKFSTITINVTTFLIPKDLLLHLIEVDNSVDNNSIGIWHFFLHEIYCGIYVVHQQDCLLPSQLRLTFPSIMDGVRNQNCSKRPRPSELGNRTPPTKSDRA